MESFLKDNFLLRKDSRQWMERIVSNLCDVSYSYFVELPKDKRYRFVKAVGYFLEASHYIKKWESTLSVDEPTWFWDGMPTYFMFTSEMIDPLEDMRRELLALNKELSLRKVVLVEGDSEAEFLKVLKTECGFYALDCDVHNYKGKGNIQNLIHYIHEKTRQGLEVYLTLDSDGQKDSFEDTLKRNECSISGTFAFQTDFEHSFPGYVLRSAIDEYSSIRLKGSLHVALRDIRDFLTGKNPIDKWVERKYAIKLRKKDLAQMLAKEMAPILFTRYKDLRDRRKRVSTWEISKFLKFVMF